MTTGAREDAGPRAARGRRRRPGAARCRRWCPQRSRGPAAPGSGSRCWQPPRVLIVGVAALLLSEQGGGKPQPAPLPGVTPSTSATASPGPRGVAIPVTPPTVPYIFDQRLYVDGSQVPGGWSFVEARGDVWLAQQSDGSWWSGGPGLDTGRIDAEIDQPPVISPNGRYVAFVDLSSGRARLTGFDSRPAGEGFRPGADRPAQHRGRRPDRGPRRDRQRGRDRPGHSHQPDVARAGPGPGRSWT